MSQNIWIKKTKNFILEFSSSFFFAGNNLSFLFVWGFLLLIRVVVVVIVAIWRWFVILWGRVGWCFVWIFARHLVVGLFKSIHFLVLFQRYAGTVQLVWNRALGARRNNFIGIIHSLSLSRFAFETNQNRNSKNLWVFFWWSVT